MRLFGYYALHTLKNQLRKLLKTWVLLFLLACVVLGGLIGVGAAMLEDAAEEQAVLSGEAVPEEEEGPSFWEEQGLTPLALLELVLGGLYLGVLAYEVMGAGKNGGRLFLPADVNLLFASPMSPQSVLMFRLSTQLGVALLSLFYFLLQLPNLTLNLGLSLWVSLAVIGSWCLLVMAGKLLQVELYLVCSNHPGFRDWLRRLVWLGLGLLGGAFLLTWNREETLLSAAAAFFNAPVSRWVPLWGWLKGFPLLAAEGNVPGVICCLLAILTAGVLLVQLIRRTRADFYEDAMARSEETAELQERARADNANGLVTGKPKKDRSERLRRDGLHRGTGAGVFFFKPLYNRFRFAHLHLLTKTGETYLVSAVLVCLLCRFGLETDVLLPAALVLAALVFFRSLGNPLAEDTGNILFLLAPESCRAKLLCSMLGGTVNCLLDLVPALAAAAAFGGDPLAALAWLPFLLSMDFYATAVGTFIGLSVPVSAGKTVKQLVQVLFIYFGLLPDAGIIAVGVVFGRAVPAIAGAALLNVFLGLVFFNLLPGFLEPKEGKQVMEPNKFTESPESAWYSDETEKAPAELRPEPDLKAAKKQFSRLGMGAFVMLLVSAVAQVILIGILQAAAPEVLESDWGTWIIFLPEYLLGYPLGLLMLRKAEATPRQGEPFGAGRWFSAAVVCIFLMYAGNILGILINALIESLVGVSGENPVETLVANDILSVQIIVLAVVGPLVEELFFRKAMIDRMRVYGERTAVIASAVIFGLIHGNLSQFFYALALGLVFGYLYVKTGRLRYSLALHMGVNFLGSIVGPAMVMIEENEGLDEALATLDFFDPEAVKALLTPGNIAFFIYSVLLMVSLIAGLITLIVQGRNIRFSPAERELPKGSRFKTVWLNAGMVLLVLLCLGLIAFNAVGGLLYA